MATCGVEVESGDACSICLEPYQGREQKLLPCYHTFCLPCLTKLVTRKVAAQTPDTAGPDSEEEGGRSADSLTCPTCRRVIPLPPGGVAGFQGNLYLDSSSSREEAPQPVPCTLCDGDHTAQVHCGQCHNKVCSQCRRYHDKCCQGGQVMALQDLSDSSSSSSTAQKPSPGQVRQQQQLQRVEEAVKKLGEEERKLKQEREAMDHSINVRYATLLRHAADARDVCCHSLREACDGLTARLHSSMAEARHAQATLQRQLSPSQPAPVATAQQRAALFLQGELQTILDRDLDTCSLLHHHTEDNPSLMTRLLHPFMGHIVKCSQASGPVLSQHPSGSLHTEDHRGAVSSVRADAENLDDLCKRVKDLAGQVTSLHSTNTVLSQQMTLLSNANSKLATDHSSLQREVATLKDNNATLTTQQAALQREVTAMRDKHAIVHQDLAVLTAEKDNAYAQLTKLQTDLTSVHTDLTSVQTDLTSVHTDLTSVHIDLTSVQTDLTSVHTDLTSVQTDLTYVQTDLTSVHTDLTYVQTDLTSVHTDLTSVQTDLTSVHTYLTSVHTDLTSMQTYLTSVHTDLTYVQTDLTSVHTDLTSVQTDLTSVHTDLTSVHTDLTSVQTDLTSVHTDTSRQQTDILQLKADHGDVLTKLSTVQTDMTALQGDQSSMKKDMTALQGDQSSMKKDMTDLQGDQSSIKKDMTALQGDQSSMKKDMTTLQGDQSSMKKKMKKDMMALRGGQSNMKKDMTALQGDQSSMKKTMTALQGDQSSMKKDMTALQGDQSSMKKTMTALQGDQSSMKKDITALRGGQSRRKDTDHLKKDCSELISDMAMIQEKLTNLESRFVTANTPVGFHAWMINRELTSQEQTLVCDGVYSNEGGRYNRLTGVFTAPVTGTYCFLATTSPNESDVDKEARLGIFVEEDMRGYVRARGKNWSTGHCVVNIKAGRKVFLKTLDNKRNTFCGGGYTRFSGMLLQAEV